MTKDDNQPDSRTRRVVLAFTDIEGSTPLWERAPEAMEAGLGLHNAALRGLIAEYGGYEVKTEGDAFMVAFESPRDAMRWCLASQEALHDLKWPEGLLSEPEAAPSADGFFQGLRVRMGVHAGMARREVDPTTGREDFFGPMVNRAARVSAAAHGGQVIVSDAVLEAADVGDDEAVLVDLGEHRLKGMEQVERLWQVLPARLSGRTFPPPRTLDPHRTNLPPRPTSFKGRKAELESIARLFDEGARLVTLLGPGGVGKTRLSCRFAAQELHSFHPGGAWLVDLTEAKSLADVLRAVSAALSVPLTSGATDEDGVVQLGNAIAGRGRVLLLMDNFEQVVELSPKTVGRWLDRAPEACFLVTSRERLMLEGETVWEVGPLSHEDATALFADRARAVRPDFAPGEGDLAAMADIVEHLDGIPLAIELAAARANMMSPTAIRDRLADRFRLLSGRSRGVPNRHATLQGTIDWSWDLLTEWEREALAQCSVFRGGWTLEAAEAVVDVSAWDDAPWTVDIIQSLRDKSLVRVLPASSDGHDMRFGLYESIREYAARKLEAPEAVETRHGKFYAKYGEEDAIETLHGRRGVEARRELGLELENLVAAARRASARGDAAVAGGAALAASEVFELRGPFDSGMSLISEALDSGPDDELAVRLGLRHGRLGFLAGKMDEALASLEPALALARKLESRRLEGLVLGNLGALHHNKGRMEEARACYDAALAIHREVGDRRFEGIALGNLGVLHGNQGRMEEARASYDAALGIHREVGNRRGEGIVLGNLGALHYEQGRVEEARACFDAALDIHGEVGNRCGEGIVIVNLGNLHWQQGRMEEVCACYDAALAIHREVGNRRFEGIVLGNLGNLHSRQGRMEEARACYDAALAIYREVGDRRFEGAVLGNLGDLHHEEGRIDDARVAFGAGEALLRAVDDSLELGKLLCGHAALEGAEGDPEEARSILAEVKALADKVGAGPESDLGLLLTETQRKIEGG